MLRILILQRNIEKKSEKLIQKLAKYVTNPKEVTQADKELISDLHYDGIEFPVQEKIFSQIEMKNNI